MTDIIGKVIDGKPHSSTTPRLVVDLAGPFVVHFVNNEVCVDIPMCTDHHANVQTDHDDISLYGIPTSSSATSSQNNTAKNGFIYTLTGPSPNRGPCENLDSGHNGYLVMKNPKIEPISESLCHLVFKIPRPDQILPLVPEWVFVHRNSSDQWLDPDTRENCEKHADYVLCQYARGLRFVYSECPVQPKIDLTECGTPEPPPQFLAQLKNCKFDADGFATLQYQFTLRFASSSTAPDDNHQDAYNCFQTMRKLIPATLQWRVDYDDVYVTKKMIEEAFPNPLLLRHGGPNPLDCNAAIMVVQS